MIEEENIKPLLMDGKSVREIMQILQVTEKSVYQSIKRHNLKKYLVRHLYKTPKDIKEQIQPLYEQKELNIGQIARKLNIGRNTVLRHLRKIGIQEDRPSNLHLNHNIFEVIDTEEKAYWLGMLYADGCVKIRTDANSISCTLKLKSSDIDHVIAFRDFIGSNLEVRKYKNKGSGEALIRAYSIKIGKDLIRHGCVPNKSLILEPPTETTLPKELNRHFIRGFFDGDGCITKSINNKPIVCFYSTYNMINWIQNIIRNETLIPLRKIVPRNSIFLCTYTGSNRILKIMDYLYQDCTVQLERKYKIFENYKNYLIEKNKNKTNEQPN